MTTITRELTPGQRAALALAMLDGSSAVATLDDVQQALENLPPSGPSEAEVEAIADASAAEVGALLSRALPSGRVLHVGAGRDHATLSAAYAALAALTGGEALAADNRYRLHLWGDVVETATVTALNHVDLVFEVGARLIFDLSARQHGLVVNHPVRIEARTKGTAEIIMRQAEGVTLNVNSSCAPLNVNGPLVEEELSRTVIRGLIIRNDIPWVRAHGALVNGTLIEDCRFYGGGHASSEWSYQSGERASGLYGGSFVTIRRSFATTRSGYIGCGFVMIPGNGMTGGGPFLLESCTGVGGGFGGSSSFMAENYGIWYSGYGPSSRHHMINCIGIGGGCTYPSILDPTSAGISAHKSGSARLVDCVGIGRNGPGLFTWGQDNNYASFEFRGCTFYGGGPMHGWGALIVGSSRDSFDRCAFVGSPDSAAAAVVWGPSGSPNIVSPQRPLVLDTCTLYGGGLGSAQQGAPTYYADSPALRVKLDNVTYWTYTEGLQLVNCALRSNTLSPPVEVLGNASLWPGIRFVGGYAASLDPATQPAIRAPLATPWADAEIYDMTLVGGVENVTVAAPPTMLGTNRVL